MGSRPTYLTHDTLSHTPEVKGDTIILEHDNVDIYR